MDIEILNKQDGGEPTRPYDFAIDKTTPLGRLFLESKEQSIDDVSLFFRKKIESKDHMVNLHLRFMITAYREFGKLRLFCGDITQKCYSEVIKNWLDGEIQKLRVQCNIY